jgi:type II secretory pathway pseudopilin PulG
VSALPDERGFTLVEAVLVLLLMTIVLGATLTAFDSFTRTAHVNEKQNDSQQEARRALDQIARDLRNLASPTDELPLALDVAKDDEIIFQSVYKTKDTPSNSYNTRRVRYCLNQTSQQIIRQTQVNPGAAVPTTTACAKGASSGSWTPGVIVAAHVVNGSRPVWFYNPPLSVTSPDPTTVTSIRAELFVDINGPKTPPETRLATGVQLRNQNRAPIADFTADSPQPGVVVLNASPSIDPEGRALRYAWYLGSSATGTPISDQISYTCCATPLSPGPQSFTLKVQDSQLSSTITKEVVVK